MNTKSSYTINREDAAKTLGVSTRTLDRYIKNNKLRFQASSGRNILIHEKDLEKLSKKPLQIQKKPKPMKKNPPATTAIASQAETIEIKTENTEEKIFRDLYEEVNKELRQKQEKLEAASFRVGQLEAQVKNSVPLLEHKQKESELNQQNSVLKEKLITSILKSWIFLSIAILAAIVAGTLGFLLYL
jgi:excisionase family DNA binding protein